MSIKIIKDCNTSFDAWDAGHHVLSETKGRLFEHPAGEKLGDILSEWTVCPVGNGTCNDMVDVRMLAINPDKPPKDAVVQLCPLGVCDIDDCPLSK